MIFKTFSDQLGNLLAKDGKKNWLAISVIFFLILSPVLLMASFSYFKTRQELTHFALSQRQAIAYLAANTLKEKLDRLVDISVSLASRVRFRQLVSEGKWDEAIDILRNVPRDFPFIDRLTMNDPSGTLVADTPALPHVRGKNFANRDWYRGVSQNWLPYVSEVYQRAAEPRYNVAAVAAPIKAEDGTVVGILVLQVKIDFLLEWTRNIEVGSNGFVVIVDKRGKIAAHPKFAPQGEIVDYAKVPAVQKLLRGDHGVELLSNPIERERQVFAYQPVPGYGWGAIVQQPAVSAFAVRDSNLRRILVAYGFILLLNCGLAYLILSIVIRLKQAEEVLKGSEERFRRMSEAAYDAIISADSGGIITYFNHGAESIFGYVASEVIGQPLTLLMPERLRDTHREGLKRFLSTGKARVIGKAVELVGTRRDGTEFPLELSLSTWRTNAGVFFTGILRDITERKRAEEEIRKINAQLEAANQELEAFSYSVSHDLRAPLRAVDGFSRILLEDHHHELSDGGQRFLRRVRENAQKMGQLIDDLLTFSRLSRQPLKKQPVAPADLARQVLEELKPEQDRRRVEISVADLPQCQADPALFKQVFVNLLSNALKYTRNRDVGQIEVACEKRNGEAVYFVKDNGTGFDMRYADKLFGVFQRLHRTEEYEGTGVGLAIVKRIVNRHGGRVWAEAEANKGATFYFTLEGGNSNDSKSSRDSSG
jgi:PAS domain S-box-containing protein